jgi:hypothetical protein
LLDKYKQTDGVKQRPYSLAQKHVLNWWMAHEYADRDAPNWLNAQAQTGISRVCLKRLWKAQNGIKARIESIHGKN